MPAALDELLDIGATDEDAIEDGMDEEDLLEDTELGNELGTELETTLERLDELGAGVELDAAELLPPPPICTSIQPWKRS
mgnify:CR=1 FL=1